MADFRKSLIAFAGVALFAGLATTASAQTCSPSSVPDVIRGEGNAELIGDIVIRCTGGVAAPAGPLQQATIRVFLQGVNVTSKKLSTDTNPFSEAVLIINEPGSVAINPGTPQLACGTAVLAPDNTSDGPGVCRITGDGNPSDSYNGTAGHPNIFQGRQIQGNAVEFAGIPFDPGQPSLNGLLSPLYLRITNIRTDAASLQLASVNQLTSISAQVTIEGISTVLVSPSSVIPQVATVQLGMAVTTVKADRNFLQCSDGTSSTVTLNVRALAANVVMSENFRSAWKARNLAQVCANNSSSTPAGTPTGACLTTPQTISNLFTFDNGANASPIPWTGTSAYPAPVAQKIPGFTYGTESGFYNPALVNGHGLENAGLADQGTRLYIKVTSVPTGTGLWFPVCINLNNGTTAPAGNSGIACLTNTDTNGGGGYSLVTGTSPVASVGAGNYSQVTVDTSQTALIVYEVIFADPNASESVTIVPAISYTTSLTTTPQTPQPNVTALVSAGGFAPFYPSVTSSTFVPRFIPGVAPSPNSLFLISKCACNLLFPWIVSDSGYTSAIEISNTSKDPGNTFGFLAKAQSGSITYFYFGQDGTTPVTSGTPTVRTPVTHGPIAAGLFDTFVVPTGFAGYIIAQAEFQYCHGIAFLFSTSAPPLNYLGLEMDKNIATPLVRTTQSTTEALDN